MLTLSGSSVVMDAECFAKYVRPDTKVTCLNAFVPGHTAEFKMLYEFFDPCFISNVWGEADEPKLTNCDEALIYAGFAPPKIIFKVLRYSTIAERSFMTEDLNIDPDDRIWLLNL